MDDPTRSVAVGRALRAAGMLAAAATVAFMALFWVSSEIGPVRDRSPWSDDPWDLVVSVAALIVPVVALITGLRFVRWAGHIEIPRVARVQMTRGLSVILLVIWAAIMAAAGAFATRVDPGAIDSTLVLLGTLLALTAVSTLAATIARLRVGRTEAHVRVAAVAATALAPSAPGIEENEPDAIDDLIVVGRGLALGVARLAPEAGVRGLRLMAAIDRFMETSAWSPRAHRIAFGIVVGVLFGIALATWHLLVEGLPALDVAIEAWMFYATAGAATAIGAYLTFGRYMQLIRPRRVLGDRPAAGQPT